MAFLCSHHKPVYTTAALLLLSFHAMCCSCQSSNTTDTLLQGQSISQNHTLISQNKRYALGFFSPTNPPSKYYIGIWFHQIPNRTVVWVCNRENPLMDPSSGSFTVTPDGNLAVLDANDQAILWSTNISSIDANTSVVLLNSGNLVLQRIANDTNNNFINRIIWQSFDHPSDTLLPTMKLYMNLSTRTGNRVVSWRTPHDPSPGEFSVGFDPATALLLMIWQGGTQVWLRYSIFGTNNFSAIRYNESNSFFVVMVESNNSSISYSYRAAEGSKTLWVMLDANGTIHNYLWEPTSNTWQEIGSDLSACAYYNSCGSNAMCNLNVKALECSCLRGYIPKSTEEWQEGNYKGGCRREVELECGDGEGFANVSGVLLPDGFRMVRDASREECEGWCVGRCGCMAYAFANQSVIGSRTRCLVWEGDIVDTRVFGAGGDELYLRLPKSELETEGSSSKTKIVIIATILPLLGMILLACSLYICKKRSCKVKRYGKSEIVVIEDLKIPEIFGEKRPKGLLALDFNKLVVSTNNFSIENKLGEGGFGPVFKGNLPGGQEIAIKMLSKYSSQGFTQFRNEVELIARLQHRNLVKLLGWCIHNNEKMLIYEYLPNKSLDIFIFDPSMKTKLNWAKRFNIVHGIAEGLLYLHRYSRLRVIHRDLKTSNILLDELMNPKISDFGLAKIMEMNQNEAITERVFGTPGYMSPEYAFDGLFSEKSDVFSFGVILLEIITGKRVTGCYPCKKSFNLLGYVWEHWKEDRIQELLDASMDDEFSEQEVLRCFQIALLCIQESAFDRPSTQSLVSMLTTNDAYLPSPKEPAFSVERCPDHAKPTSESIASTPLNVSNSTRIINNNTQFDIKDHKG